MAQQVHVPANGYTDGYRTNGNSTIKYSAHIAKNGFASLPAETNGSRNTQIAAPRTISILGATGSIGVQTVDVVERFPELFRVGWLTTNSRIEELEAQLCRVNARGVAIANEQAYQEFKRITHFKGKIVCGEEGICEAAADSETDIIMSALVGFSGVLPTVAAIRQGTTIALANKETLVSAGCVVMPAAKAHGVEIIPVDSEHSAMQQCLVGEEMNEIEKLILTASGGPFRNNSQEELEHVTAAQALKHPNWSMGSKITIDSSTLMNKGFEMIEAYWLFGVPAEHIEIVVHPQSIIHSMVQFRDGSVKAQLGLPDMKIPIAYALSAPKRLVSDFPRMNIMQLQNLTFFAPDMVRFPCLRLAFEALSTGGTAPTMLNAANEIAVREFLHGNIGFMDIPRLIEQCLCKIHIVRQPTLDDILATDKETRAFAATTASTLAKTLINA